MSPQDLSFISSSSEESLLGESLVMEGAVDANVSSAGPGEAVVAVAVPSQSSDEDDETIHEDVASIKVARALLENTHPKQTVVELAGHYTIQGYDKLFGNGEGSQGKWCHHRLVSGKVQLFELPSHLHESAAAGILLQLRDQHRCVMSKGSGDIVIDETTKLEPDESIYISKANEPRPGAVDARGNRLPKIVVEVSHSELCSSIGSLPTRYFSVGGEEGIQGVILVFIRHADPPVEGRYQMVALLYDYRADRDAAGYPVPSAAISFGDYLHGNTKTAIAEHCRVPEGLWTGALGVQPEVVCDRPELEPFQLQIDGELLWRGYDPAARARLAANNEAFVVDLFELKAGIKDDFI
eukprot:gene12737-9106_t